MAHKDCIFMFGEIVGGYDDFAINRTHFSTAEITNIVEMNFCKRRDTKKIIITEAWAVWKKAANEYGRQHTGWHLEYTKPTKGRGVPVYGFHYAADRLYNDNGFELLAGSPWPWDDIINYFKEQRKESRGVINGFYKDI